MLSPLQGSFFLLSLTWGDAPGWYLFAPLGRNKTHVPRLFLCGPLRFFASSVFFILRKGPFVFIVQCRLGPECPEGIHV